MRNLMNKLRTSPRFQKAILALLIPAFSMVTVPGYANPTGANVVQGGITISNAAANTLQITQAGQAAIIDWQSFSISAGETTEFIQPNSSASVLNRVVTGNPSAIYGTLKANGNVIVINPNGIVVGPGGVVDVGGMVALSTLDMRNDDFLNGGTSHFYGNSTTGVTNFGTIASAHGDVLLMGGFVDNQGQIGALDGTVAIGAGGDILVQDGGGTKISVRGSSDYTGTGISNSGSITGAAAELKAHGNVFALAINNGGAIRANGASRVNGRVRLTSSGSSSRIVNTGSVAAANQDGSGGEVDIDAGATGSVDVSGDVSASAVGNGVKGGSVKIAGGTVTQEMGSTIEARGKSLAGTIRVDGVESTSVDGTVTVDSSNGNAGDILVAADSVALGSHAAVSAEGFGQGGRIRVGGEFRGNDIPGFREADSVSVAKGASLSADSDFGDAGSVVVWSNNDTIFRGDVSASARGQLFGNGGLVEVSGLQTLTYDGIAEAISVSEKSGTVLFDPGDISVGLFATPGPNELNISSINTMLQGGTSVLLMTQSGSIIINRVAQGGNDDTGNAQADRDQAIQWTNSAASFGAFASENIFINNHIRTSGGGSINLLSGWGGQEADLTTLFPGPGGAPAYADGGNGLFSSVSAPATVDVQSIWDYYVNNELFGANSGLITVGSASMATHVEVGSRFGNTNLAARAVTVTGSDSETINRFAQIGFVDNGNVFAPRLDNGGGIVIDMTDGSGKWILSDGLNSSNQAVAGVGDPVVGVVGRFEVDKNGDGIMDGVNGIDHSGQRTDTFIPYANHFNSASSGNWWWQQIEDSGNTGPKDASGLGGLRPEYGAGGRNGLGAVDITKRADINVIATGAVVLDAGEGRDANYAQIGHGGFAQSWGGATRSVRDQGGSNIFDPNVNRTTFGINGVERGQLERKWSINGSTSDRQATSIARLGAVRGNINVLAGVDTTQDVSVDHVAGTVSATVNNPTADIIVRANQNYETGNISHNSYAQIGHGGIGQSGQFFGDIRAEAGGKVDVLGGTGTRSHATIGHTLNGYAYYNITDNVDQQIRFFAIFQDQRNPNLRRGELFSTTAAATGTTGFDPAKDPATRAVDITDGIVQNPRANGAGDPTGLTTAVNVGDPDPGNLIDLEYIDDRGLLTLSQAGPVTVDALDGSIANGLHGDVTVIAHSGNVTVSAGSTPADSSTAQARDRRFAGIGHGGASFAQWTDGAGFNGSGATPSGTENREVVALSVGNSASGSRSVVGSIGSTPGGRGLLFMSMSGDITVDASADVSVTAGNDVHDYARIGHGGAELADAQTSSFVIGDILINAGGDFNLTAGGSVKHESNRNNFDMSAMAQVGHGGFRTQFMDFTGDIEINVGGDFHTKGGAYRFNYVQIGHGGFNNFSQAGGNYSRNETFLHDNVSTDMVINLDDTDASVTYSVTTNAAGHAHAGVGLPGSLSFNAGELITSPGSGKNTSNISIDVTGNVLMDHMGEQEQLNANQLAANRTQGSRTNDAWNIIGHGGMGEDALRENNPDYNFGDKIGNITLISEGNVTMENGNGTDRFTRIGHGLTAGAGNSANLVSAVELIGDIDVDAAGDVIVNARAATPNGNPLNAIGVAGFAIPSTDNPVAIGHGGTRDNRDVVVLGSGEDIHGILASSDITVTAGGNMEVLGGNGQNFSFAQVGHGYGGNGDDRATRNGLPTGFTGDIDVLVEGDLKVEGSPNASIPSPIQGSAFALSQGAFAAIGHGGYQLDAPANGKINVYVGNNLDITAQQRIQGPAESESNTGVFLTTPANFAKIGHVGFEHTGLGVGPVTDSNMNGDIFVVVGNNMTMTGGKFGPLTAQEMTDGKTARVVGAFAQVGHGGPGITGDLNGDVTVVVGNNLTTVDGSADTSGPTGDGSDNYVMIGNGDWLRDGASFSSFATGTRAGDITVLVGETANLDHTLIGHADPDVGSNSIASGNTGIGVSRNNPFFGGTGQLLGSNNVFSSGGYGQGSRASFYLPGRSNNKLDDTTRINETTTGFLMADADFVDASNGDTWDSTRNGGLFAGRSDEVYLTPDLWWDFGGIAASNGIPGGADFPTDASGSQGGSIANVLSPGGISNLDTLTPGTLGTSGAANYRSGNGVSGAGNYTFFYDAVSPVSFIFVPPAAFGGLFDFAPFAFADKFDTFDRNELAGEIQGGGEVLFGSLGAFEGLIYDSEDEPSKLEQALDNQLGPRTNPNSDGEQEESEARRRARGLYGAGPLGLTYYVFDPGTNRYSSYRLFGVASEDFYPTSAP